MSTRKNTKLTIGDKVEPSDGKTSKQANILASTKLLNKQDILH